jgi:isopentenyldiphosphate isomerase
MFDLYEEPTSEERAGAPVARALRPMGRKARSKVHAEGDWHRAVHVWLVDREGGLLLQRRSEHKDTFPGRLDVSVGGHIESG